MSELLDETQLSELKMTIYMNLNDFEVVKKETSVAIYDFSALGYLKKFLAAKVVERKSNDTIKYYGGVLKKFVEQVPKNVEQITTDDIRHYLYKYKSTRNINKTTMDNIRRILSSFFKWLQKNRYIHDNPMDLIERIKPDQTIKECFTDEQIVIMRDSCTNLRDLALVDFLNSSMIRVGELVKLNISDINFNERECIVFGKGSKEREVYIDGNAKIHLLKYIASRKDNNPALFVSRNAPHRRLTRKGVQNALSRLGSKTSIRKLHPHKFRRTGATRYLDKGMPIEQVKELLGHSRLDTTMIYLNINKNIVKSNYQRLA